MSEGVLEGVHEGGSIGGKEYTREGVQEGVREGVQEPALNRPSYRILRHARRGFATFFSVWEHIIPGFRTIAEITQTETEHMCFLARPVTAPGWVRLGPRPSLFYGDILRRCSDPREIRVFHQIR